jgi:hypothetical protein
VAMVDQATKQKTQQPSHGTPPRSMSCRIAKNYGNARAELQRVTGPPPIPSMQV